MSPAAGPSRADPASTRLPPGRLRLLDEHRWLVFLLPYAVYLVAGSLDPTPDRPGGSMLGLAIPYAAYPLLYTLKIGLTLAAMALVLPAYRGFAFRVSLRAVAVGVLGLVVWVGLARLALDRRALGGLGLGWLSALGDRPALDPLRQFAGAPGCLAGFLAVRFLGLVLIVPIIEEFFLRGFLMRLVMAPDWWQVPFGRVNRAALAVSLLFPALTHPAEMLPAVAWFALVTWLMVRTRNLWDCVAAHATTNLLLGIYVLATGNWSLW
ncbi:MAG: CAAX prenyl protease-related protein [Thermoguttaceae bacterium]|jgi:CAAX prenyl protease-like protein